MSEKIKPTEYQIFGGTLTPQSVSITKDGITKAYINSEVGRAELLREVTDEAVIEQVMAQWGDSPTVFPQPLPEPDIEALRAAKLADNSKLCGEILENEFQSKAKGDGLQPYRMNRDDQANLNGMMGLINTALIMGTKPEDMPLFSWQNANQTECVNDWHFSQILGLIQDFGAWKTLMLKRQDAIKAKILGAETVGDLEAVELDYSDLLMFGGDSA